ncbi:MAG: hypothetical protein KIT84_28675 [Labilithrix sp.]|nr:hypothetical protein [Labilithrix sp.]MCW5815035.1 hypothetical protein [Labilithrix sp.]
MSPRFLFAAATVAALSLAATKPAEACSPPDHIDPTEIRNVQLQREGGLPKNGALRFQIAAGESLADLASIAARVQVDVKKGGETVAGAFRLLDDQNGAIGYFWSADGGGLPVGALTVTITFAEMPDGEPRSESYEVTVDDRVLTATPAQLTVKATAYELDDPSSPKIQCTTKGGLGDCSGGRDRVSEIATRRVAWPYVTFTAAEVPAGDRGLLKLETDVFGRNKDGTTSTRLASSTRIFEETWDEYCVHATTHVIGEVTKVENTVCVPHAMDLHVDEAKVAAFVKQQVAACDSAVYPPGTSAEDPTGTESDGCHAGARSSATPTGVLVALFGLALVRGRRARGRRCPPPAPTPLRSSCSRGRR